MNYTQENIDVIDGFLTLLREETELYNENLKWQVNSLVIQLTCTTGYQSTLTRTDSGFKFNDALCKKSEPNLQSGLVRTRAELVRHLNYQRFNI